jgi:hypothetical protein
MAGLGNIGGFGQINTNYSKSPVGQQKIAGSSPEIADGFVSSGATLNEMPSPLGASTKVDIPAEFVPFQTTEMPERPLTTTVTKFPVEVPGLGSLGVITELSAVGFSDAPKGTTLGVHTNGVGSGNFFGLGGRVYN